MVKSICEMKNGKASSVVTEILKVSSDICSELIADFTDSMVVKIRCQVNGMTILFSAYSKVKVKL